MILPYAYVSELTDEAHQAIYEEVNAGKRHHQTVEPAREVLKRVFHKVFPGEPVRVVQSEDSCIYSPLAIQRSVVPERFVEAQIRRETDQLITFEDDVLFLDIETHNAERLYDMDRREFFRLGQYAWGEGPVQVTTDIDEVLAQIGKARLVYAHNGHNFDFNALLGDDALHLAYESKLFDTFVFAALHFPAPTRYLHSNGRNYTDYNTKPGHTARWLGLENLAFQFGFPGKLGNLQELAARHNPPKTKVADLDYGLIPLNDPKFLAYAEQDIIALRDLTRSMLSVVPVDAYSEREQFKWALLAQFSRNGCAVDVPEIQRRVQRSADQAQAIMAELVEQYDFPTEGKAPWSSKLGKQALERILADYGITPDTVEWDRTASGALSFGKDVMIAITKGTAAESVGQAIAALQGDRGLPQQVLDYLAGDGLIHPRIESLQRSGRSSVTSPGLTTWGSRTDKAREDKEYFIPRPGNVLIELDLSNADQRAVAFMSKDPRYAERFLPGVDGHEITGRLMFGDAVYDSDPTGNRNIAKALSHAYAYGAGAKKLALTAQGRLAHLTPDEVLELAELFVSTMQSHYPQMTRWQNEIRREGGSGWVYNLWGRPCPVDPERAYTQAPALAGQSSTTELLLDCWINMYERDPSSLKRILFPIHDAILCEVPLREAETFSRFVVSCADQTINGIEIFLEAGHPGKSWSAAMHG